MMRVVQKWFEHHPGSTDANWNAQNLIGDLITEGVIEGDMEWYRREWALAGRYWDEVITADPDGFGYFVGLDSMTASKLRSRYIQDAMRNPIAMQQLEEWERAGDG